MNSRKYKVFNQLALIALLFTLTISCQTDELKNLEFESELESTTSKNLGCACTEQNGGAIVEVNNNTYLKCPNGLYFEGDMAYTEEQIQNNSLKSRGYAYENNRWENGVIYLKNYAVSNPQHSKVYKAIKELEIKTNLIVVPMDNTNSTQPQEYLQINGYASGNWAQYGAHSPSTINLKPDVHQGIVIHELGHIAGLVHEHKRPDRDDFVNYYPANVQYGQAYNFDIGEGHSTHGSFDFNSIMIYGSYQWSKNGLPTLTKKDGSTWGWNLSGYSQGDVTAINSIYPNSKRETIRHSMEGTNSDWQQSEATVFQPESNAFIVGIGVSVAGDNVTTLKVKYANINNTGETTFTWIESAGSLASSTPETWVEVPQGYVITGLGIGILNDNVRTLRAYARQVEYFEDGGNNQTKIRLSSNETIYNVGSKPDAYLETEVKLDSQTKTLQGIGLRSFNDHMFNSKGYSYDHELSYGNDNSSSNNDTDGDGISDDLDECPDDATNQCNNSGDTVNPNDRDGDGIWNDWDDCPDDATNQCNNNDDTVNPNDRDGDGIWNDWDDCPDDATNQCNNNDDAENPNDRDGDGIWNDWDKCPDDATNQCDG